MSDSLNIIEKISEIMLHPTLDNIGILSIVLIIYFSSIFAVLQTELGKKVIRIMRLLFYSEASFEASTVARRRLVELDEEVQALKKVVSSKSFEIRKDALRAEIENQLEQELHDIVRRKLEDIKALDAAFEPSIQLAINTSIETYLKKFGQNDIISAQNDRARSKERETRSAILERTIEDQMRSVGRLKAVMINLFVLFNIGVLLIYLFAASSLTDRAVTAIIGLYISLAAFIVYIYRTSNFRSSVLLSLREDAKKYFDGEEYLRRMKPGTPPSERDIEVLRLLLLNRAEREKMAEHPYEVVLKGVTNSNIQFKGGKITPSTKLERMGR